MPFSVLEGVGADIPDDIVYLHGVHVLECQLHGLSGLARLNNGDRDQTQGRLNSVSEMRPWRLIYNPCHFR